MIFVQKLIDGVVGDPRLVSINTGFHGIKMEPLSSLTTLIFLWDPYYIFDDKVFIRLQ